MFLYKNFFLIGIGITLRDCNWTRTYSQRNYCVFLLKKSKRGYYENLNIKNVTDNYRSPEGSYLAAPYIFWLSPYYYFLAAFFLSRFIFCPTIKWQRKDEAVTTKNKIGDNQKKRQQKTKPAAAKKLKQWHQNKAARKK